MPLNIIAEKTPRQHRIDAHWAATKTWRRANNSVAVAERNLAELIAAERLAFSAMEAAAKAVSE